MPKPLVEFANKPMIEHQIEALADAGVTDVVLAVNYRPEIMEDALKEVSCTPIASTRWTSSIAPSKLRHPAPTFGNRLVDSGVPENSTPSDLASTLPSPSRLSLWALPAPSSWLAKSSARTTPLSLSSTRT